MTFTYTGYCAISGCLFNVQGTGCRGGHRGNNPLNG